MYLGIYRFLSLIGGPMIDIYLHRRRQNGKEDPQRFQERLGRAGLPRPGGKLVWAHAASVGEIMSILPLIQRISERYAVNILITTGTVTSAKLMQTRLPPRTFHQYVPVDRLAAVRRFLEYWQPDLALWVESELWPNLIVETQRRGCSMIQVNARISMRSFQIWHRYRGLAERILRCFSLSLAQSEEDKTRLQQLGAPNVKYVGNLKFDAPPLPADPTETGRLIAMIGDRPLWVAASTHPGEEKLIADAHRKLKAEHPSLLTVVVPRHPERGTEIAAAMSGSLQTILRSSGQPVASQTDIYIVDSIGELGIFYRLAGIVFTGGSLVRHGGQNPLEAARLESAIITGPHTENFAQIYAELEQGKALVRVQNETELAEAVDRLLRQGGEQQRLAATALALVESRSGVLETYLNELAPHLKPLQAAKV